MYGPVFAPLPLPAGGADLKNPQSLLHFIVISILMRVVTTPLGRTVDVARVGYPGWRLCHLFQPGAHEKGGRVVCRPSCDQTASASKMVATCCCLVASCPSQVEIKQDQFCLTPRFQKGIVYTLMGGYKRGRGRICQRRPISGVHVILLGDSATSYGSRTGFVIGFYVSELDLF